MSIESVRQIGPYGTSIASLQRVGSPSIASPSIWSQSNESPPDGVYDDEYKNNHNGINPIALIVPIEVKLWLKGCLILVGWGKKTYASFEFPAHHAENKFKIADPGHVP